MDRTRLLEAVEELSRLTLQFHAVKGIRAWAADENKETKTQLLQKIEQLRVYIKYATTEAF